MNRVIIVVGMVLAASPAWASGGSSLEGVTGQWWSPMWAAKWAGLIGGGFGTLCGILGALMGWLAPKGKARGFVMGTMLAFVAASAVALLAGVVALFSKQPFWVSYPLLLVGFIGTVVMGGLIPVVRARYLDVEMRMMDAQDAGAGCGQA
ncbi:MAG: hypothetical protein KBC96_11905 [Armatimonadetes bacterium]|nr:hypothetical protein [Armatimonadota bacterium]